MPFGSFISDLPSAMRRPGPRPSVANVALISNRRARVATFPAVPGWCATSSARSGTSKRLDVPALHAIPTGGQVLRSQLRRRPGGPAVASGRGGLEAPRRSAPSSTSSASFAAQFGPAGAVEASRNPPHRGHAAQNRGVYSPGPGPPAQLSPGRRPGPRSSPTPLSWGRRVRRYHPRQDRRSSGSEQKG